MKFLIFLVLWCILFALCWPLALLVLVFTPFVALLVLPFWLLGMCVGAVFATIKAILFLPARLLGGRPC